MFIHGSSVQNILRTYFPQKAICSLEEVTLYTDWKARLCPHRFGRSVLRRRRWAHHAALVV
jgi:hypothetical protein